MCVYKAWHTTISANITNIFRQNIFQILFKYILYRSKNSFIIIILNNIVST